MQFTDRQLRRYARQIILPEIGGRGQARLLDSRVLVIGAGGLGSPLLLYLAAAGIGTLGVVDDDHVDLTNLHRQILHDSAQLGARKVDSAVATLARINPDIRVVRHGLRLDAGNAEALVAGYDLVADGSDSFETRDAVHAACHAVGRTLVSAAVQGFDGQLTTFKAHRGPPHPCLRCLYPEPPAPGTVPTCAQAGVLGPVAGMLGCQQAVEVVKELLDLGDSLSGSLVVIDALAARTHRVGFARDPACPRCSVEPATVP